MNFALWRTHDGTASVSVSVFSPEQLPPAGEGCWWVAIEGEATSTTLVLENGVTREIPCAELYPVVVSLQQRKADRWEDARAYRNKRQSDTCATPSGVVQIDPDSQRKISGAALAAMISKSESKPFSINWTMADDTVVSLDEDATIAVGLSVTTYLEACQRAGTAIRALIFSAPDEASLAAIDITAGYPT